MCVCTCDLERERFAMERRDTTKYTIGEVRIYARIESGSVGRLVNAMQQRNEAAVCSRNGSLLLFLYFSSSLLLYTFIHMHHRTCISVFFFYTHTITCASPSTQDILFFDCIIKSCLWELTLVVPLSLLLFFFFFIPFIYCFFYISSI